MFTAETRMSMAPLLFLAESILSQCIGIAVLIITWSLLPSLPVALLLATITAVSTSIFLGLSLPWQLLNVLIIPCSAAVLAVPLPSWLLFAILIASVVIYAPAFWTRVPYYPTSRASYALLLAELPVDKPFSFVDIGCGFGDLILFLSKHRPNGHFTGVEIGVLPYVVGTIRALVFGKGKVRVRFVSMWSLSLSEWDVVYTFLSPAPMSRLWEKVQSEMKTGSLFITNSFAVPAKANRTVVVKDERSSTLYFHDVT